MRTSVRFGAGFTYLAHCGWITTNGLHWKQRTDLGLLERRTALQCSDSKHNDYFYGVRLSVRR